MKGKKYNINKNIFYIFLIITLYKVQFNYGLEIDKFLGVPDDSNNYYYILLIVYY